MGCEMSWLTHFLDNQVTHGGVVFSPIYRPPFTPRIPFTHSCQRLSQPQGHSAAGRMRSIEKISDLTGNRTCNLPACSIVPQSTALPRSRIIITTTQCSYPPVTCSLFEILFSSTFNLYSSLRMKF
jgi:hypothetical protein